MQSVSQRALATPLGGTAPDAPPHLPCPNRKGLYQCPVAAVTNCHMWKPKEAYYLTALEVRSPKSVSRAEVKVLTGPVPSEVLGGQSVSCPSSAPGATSLLGSWLLPQSTVTSVFCCHLSSSLGLPGLPLTRTPMITSDLSA